MWNKQETTYCRPEARNAKEIELGLSQNVMAKHFEGLKAESYPQDEVERSVKALGIR